MPVASFLPKSHPNGFEYRGKLRREESGAEGQDKIGYFTRPIQGMVPFRQGSRSGDIATNKAAPS